MVRVRREEVITYERGCLAEGPTSPILPIENPERYMGKRNMGKEISGGFPVFALQYDV